MLNGFAADVCTFEKERAISIAMKWGKGGRVSDGDEPIIDILRSSDIFMCESENMVDVSPMVRRCAFNIAIDMPYETNPGNSVIKIRTPFGNVCFEHGTLDNALRNSSDQARGLIELFLDDQFDRNYMYRGVVEAKTFIEKNPRVVFDAMRMWNRGGPIDRSALPFVAVMAAGTIGFVASGDVEFVAPGTAYSIKLAENIWNGEETPSLKIVAQDLDHAGRGYLDITERSYMEWGSPMTTLKRWAFDALLDNIAGAG